MDTLLKSNQNVSFQDKREYLYIYSRTPSELEGILLYLTVLLTLCLLVMLVGSADNFRKQFEHRSGPTTCRA